MKYTLLKIGISRRVANNFIHAQIEKLSKFVINQNNALKMCLFYSSKNISNRTKTLVIRCLPEPRMDKYFYFSFYITDTFLIEAFAKVQRSDGSLETIQGANMFVFLFLADRARHIWRNSIA